MGTLKHVLKINSIPRCARHCFTCLPRDPGNAGPPLKVGLRPGGKGEICGRGKDEGGKGTCGRGPGNIE